jgi:hypothetical protein
LKLDTQQIDTADHPTGVPATTQIVLLLLVSIILLDSLFAYALTNLFHVSFPINSLVPAALLVALFVTGARVFAPSRLVLGGMLLIALAFAHGILVFDLFPATRLFKLAGALIALVVGYAAGRWVTQANLIARMYFVIGGLYALVCVVALSGVLPAYFPVINALGYRDGQMILRPEVTTDQNFQIFYLFPSVLLFLMPLRRPYLVAVGLMSIAAAYTLTQLYSRSGVLVLGMALLFAWAAPLRYPMLGRTKVAVLPLLFAVVSMLSFAWISSATREISIRFTDSRHFRTLDDRIDAAMFLFEHLADFEYWLPRGNHEYVLATGNVPHFNATALYLEAGLLGVLLWFAMVAVPMALLIGYFVRGRLDMAALLMTGGGMASFLAQMSLNAPLYDHVWLWAGCVMGCLGRIRAPGRHPMRPQDRAEQVVAVGVSNDVPWLNRGHPVREGRRRRPCSPPEPGRPATGR